MSIEYVFEGIKYATIEKSKLVHDVVLSNVDFWEIEFTRWMNTAYDQIDIYKMAVEHGGNVCRVLQEEFADYMAKYQQDAVIIEGIEERVICVEEIE